MINKKIKLKTILLMVTGLVVFNIGYNKTNVEEDIKLKSTNMLTMMLETEAETGNYEEVKQSEWPQDGYVFNASLSRCENGGTLSWDEEAKKVIMKSNTSDKCYVYFDIYVEPTLAEICNGKTLANCIKENVYTADGENGLYYHDGVGSYTNASEEAGDNSYRYSGANPNNYVCFGSDAATCPNDNLYRIIGLFDDDQDGTYNIKLIKNTSIGDDSWDSGDSNTWNASTKPSIRTTLNSTFLGTINSTWQEKIATQNWKVGGMDRDDAATAKEYYNTEIGSSSGSTTDNMKIGLMYVSDYGYAAAPSNWTTALNDYDNATSTNWLYLGSSEWTISRMTDTTDYAFRVLSTGYVYPGYMPAILAVRPSFYLESSVVLTGGTGNSGDPYRLA